MTDYAIKMARLNARRYRLSSRLARTARCSALRGLLEAKAERYAEIAARWREVA